MRNKYVVAVAAWLVFIAYACLSSADTIPKAAWFNIPNKDKIVHFIFYFVLTLLLIAVYKVKIISLQKAWLYAFLTAVTYGIIIEVCQGVFTVNRSADVMDGLANATGSAAAIFVLWLLQLKRK